MTTRDLMIPLTEAECAKFKLLVDKAEGDIDYLYFLIERSLVDKIIQPPST
jgi:hypothetical protein